MKYYHFLILMFLSLCLSLPAEGVNSTKGKIDFDIQFDGTPEMTLNSNGLGIGTNSPTSNLDLRGSLGFGRQTVSGNVTLSNNPMILADTSSDNVEITLPSASSLLGRVYHIKKTSPLNQVTISSSSQMDSFDAQIIMSSPENFLSKCSLISDGSQWLVLEHSSDVTHLIGADNLVGWWKLDETTGTTAYDSSGHDFNGTLSGTFTFSGNGVRAIERRGLLFDGTDDLITVSENDALDPIELTLMAWIKVDHLHATTGNFF